MKLGGHGRGFWFGLLKCSPALVLFAELVDPLLHLLYVTPELVDLLLAGATGCGPAGGLSLAGLRPRLAPGEWREHGKDALEQFHIQAGLVFQRTERATKRLSDLLTEFFLSRVRVSSDTSR